MKLKAILLASAVCFAATQLHAEGTDLLLPSAEVEASTIDVEEDRSFFDTDDDPEIDTQTDLFLERGFKRLELLAHGALVDKVYEELAAPDYEQRTGKQNPNAWGIEIAQAYITKRGFYDIVVLSRMPGDCTSEGCLFQIYSLIGREWYKQLEFRAMDFVYRDGKLEEETHVVAVAAEDTTSRIFTWDGEKFVH